MRQADCFHHCLETSESAQVVRRLRFHIAEFLSHSACNTHRALICSYVYGVGDEAACGGSFPYLRTNLSSPLLPNLT